MKKPLLFAFLWLSFFVARSQSCVPVITPAASVICAGESVQLNASLASPFTENNFAGNYAPARWTIINGPGGSVNTTLAPASIAITSGNNGTTSQPAAGNTDFRIGSSATQRTVSFNWSYATTDTAGSAQVGPAYDPAQYVLGSTARVLPGFNASGAFRQNGTATIIIPAGQTFTLRMNTQDGMYGSATVVISNFKVVTQPNFTWSPSTGLSSTSGITVTASPTVTSTYTVQANMGYGNCSSTTSITIHVGASWTGTADRDWYNAANWCGGVPTATQSAIIRSGLGNYPQITNNAFVQNLIVATGASVSLMSGSGLEVSGALTLNSGTMNMAGFTTLNLKGTFVNNAGSLNATGGTVTFSSPTSVTIPALAYHNLVLQGGGTKTAGGNITVNNDLVLANTGLTFENNHTLTVKGHLENNALQTGSGKMVLTGGAAKHEISGIRPLQNLELNNALGAKLLNNIAVNNLTLTQGIFDTEGYTLTLNNNLIGENSSRYLKGQVAKTILINGAGSHSFGNIGVTFNNTGGGNWGNVLVTRTTGSYVSNPANASKQSILRRWNIQPAIQAATNVNLTLQWLRSEENGLIFPDSEAQIWKSEDNEQNWKPVEMLKPFTTNGDLRSMGVQTSSFSFWTVSDLNNPLPVTWLSFKGKAEAKSNVLTWATATEQNSSHFNVEVSADGKQFEAIGTVKAAGNSQQVQHYTFTDENASVFASKTLYYRLKQTDFDGRFEYSPLISIARKPEVAAINAYPNPFAETLTLELNAVSLPGKCSIELVSAEGKTVFKTEEKVEKGQRILKLESLPAISSGLYLLKIRQHDQLTILKVNRQ